MKKELEIIRKQNVKRGEVLEEEDLQQCKFEEMLVLSVTYTYTYTHRHTHIHTLTHTHACGRAHTHT